ncbi:MAG: CmcJ/NvfI family oxidoreductase [Thiolinea sp.]
MADVCAGFEYLRHDSPQAGFIMRDFGEETVNLGCYETQYMPVHDARENTERFNLDEHGFVLLNHEVAPAQAFSDDRAITQHYYPEISALLREYLQATAVIIIDHTQRSSQPTPGLRRTAAHVHNDYTAASCWQRLRDSVGDKQAAAWAERRLLQVNVWRPLTEPVRVAPLGLLDGRSVAFGDLVPSPIIYPERRGEIYSVRHNPHHRWHYFSQMRCDEVLLFKGYDSAENGAVKFTPHAAFKHPDSKPDDPPRRSIEVRTLVLI